MLTVDGLIKQADFKRSRQDDFEGAIVDYLVALCVLDQGDDRCAICLQQVGNCFKSLHRYEEALDYLGQALVVATPIWLRAAIQRDIADVYRRLKDLNKALQILDEALQMLSPKEHADQYGITLSWIGRVERDLDYRDSALNQFMHADQILAQADNRAFELYNLLDLADQYCLCGHPIKGRRAARRAFKLARREGSKLHRARALLIMTMGHSAQPIIQAVAHHQGR